MSLDQAMLIVYPTLQMLKIYSNNTLQNIDTCSEHTVSIDRADKERFWAGVLSFYKGAIAKPEKLKKALVINFVNGEDGCDAGALKKEFFEDSLKEVNNRLFEGEDTRRVPRKDASLESMFEIAGMIFSHSILQEGPAMPCLSPSVFDYMVHHDSNLCYPCKEDVPLTVSTHELITFIDEVCIIKY